MKNANLLTSVRFTGDYDASALDIKDGELHRGSHSVYGYDPFTLYYPRLRQGEHSPYVFFLNLNTSDPQEIRGFCEQFGLLFDKNFTHIQEIQSYHKHFTATIMRPDYRDALAIELNAIFDTCGVRMELEWDIQRASYVMRIISNGLMGYLAWMISMDLLGGGRFVQCPNPKCRALFMTSSDRIRYCSKKCYNVHKVQKCLALKKQKARIGKM